MPNLAALITIPELAGKDLRSLRWRTPLRHQGAVLGRSGKHSGPRTSAVGG